MEVSERRYRRLFESAHDGILILEAETGKIVDANPFLLDLLGYRPDELLGKQPWEIGMFADIEANKAALNKLQEKGYIRYEDLPLQPKNGHEQIDVEVVSNVYQEGERQVIQCNIRDIRPRKAATDAARRDDQALKVLSAEFLARAAHELRGPLMVMLGWEQAMSRPNASPRDATVGLEAILRSARAQSRVVNDLMDASRMIFGKLQCECKPLDVAEIVADAVEDASPEAEESRIELKWTPVVAGPLMVNGDAARLHQVFGNILHNALKFTPEGGTIYVSVMERAANAVIEIRDTGRGIAQDLLPGIFDAFRQSDDRAVQRHGGLGLGLAIVKEIVTLHGGQVTAESRAGATFTVSLPLPSPNRPVNEPPTISS